MTATNKHKGIALFLILFLTTLSITLANATTENNYKNTTNLLPRIYESTHTENGYKANIIINPQTTGIYAKENNYKLDLTINPQGIGGSHSENNYRLDLIPEKNFPHTPDIAVKTITLSKTVVGQGYASKIKTAISNQELYYETFYVTLYANTTTIKTQTITLTSGNSTTVTFTWNTTGVAKGNYTITAKATQLPYETDTTDNTYIDGWVVVTWLGDLDGDFDVDQFDFWHFCDAFIDYYKIHVKDPLCDFDDDCDIDQFDFWYFCDGFIDYYKAK